MFILLIGPTLKHDWLATKPYLTGACTPKIDGSSKPHGEGVLVGPVEQVEVKIILQLRSIQDLEGGLGDLSRHPPR